MTETFATGRTCTRCGRLYPMGSGLCQCGQLYEAPAPMTILEAASWALTHVYHEDRANAAMHCAAVKFSPITFRLAEAIQGFDPTDEIIKEVMSHRGAYQEDAGR